MASTKRMVDTRFWSDGWVRKLNALDRYLFLYLITNSHVNWCGVYELDISMMAFESGIDERDLERVMIPRLSPKIIYEDGWVFIQNFSKYHTGGPNAEKGMKAALNALPDRIKAKIKEISVKEEEKNNPLRPPSASASASAFTSASAQSVGEKISPNIKTVEPVDLELANLLLGKILDNHPTFKLPDIVKWSDQIRLMRERDERTPEQIRYLIEWCQKDNFWQANILSTKKLREKCDTLIAQVKRKSLPKVTGKGFI